MTIADGPKHNLGRAFVDNFIENDEKVLSFFYETCPVQDKSEKSILYLGPKNPKLIPYL